MGKTFNCETKPLALVVDDDAFIRADIADMLADLGFSIAEADCVSAALAFLQREGESVSLLLTDLQMPGSRNGATLANHASFVWPHIQILVTSGVKRPVDGELPYAAQFISKPLTSVALNAYVANFPSNMLPHRPL